MQAAPGRAHLALILGLVLLVFGAGAMTYAGAQMVWIDETTQLSGATLSIGRLFAWLTGELKIPFGVPPDRMPPVSYLVDIAGWRLWGTDPFAFRLYHALIAGGGLAVLVIAMARRFGLRAALIAGLILALSPKLIETAVEIRAYPLFFALSCAQVALLLHGDLAARPARLALFMLLGLLSAYTHFFGVVATSAYFVALFVDARTVRSSVRAVAAYLGMAVLWAGLAPFVTGAAAISAKSPPPLPGLGDIAAFVVQLLGSAPLMVKPGVALLYFAGAGVLVLLGLAGLLGQLARKGIAVRHETAFALALAVLAGVTVSILAGFLIKGFNALSPRYSIWMLPPVAVLIALAADGIIAPAGRFPRLLRVGALVSLAAGAVWGQAFFLMRAEWFVHGPSRHLEALVRQAGPDAALVHVGNGWPWGFFPLYWQHRDALPQWLLTPDGRAVIRIGRGGDASGTPQPLSALAGHDRLILSRIELNDYADLRALDTGRAMPAGGDLAPALSLGGWRGGDSLYRPGNYAFTGQLYERQPASPSSDSPAPADPPVSDKAN